MRLGRLGASPPAPPDGRGAPLESLVPAVGRCYWGDAALRVAVRRLRRWEAGAAYSYLLRLVAQQPELLDAYRLLAEAYQMHYHFREALGALDEVLRRDPVDLHALAVSVMILDGLDENDERLARDKIVASLDPVLLVRVRGLTSLVNEIVASPRLNGVIERPDALALFGEPALPDGRPTPGLLERLKACARLAWQWPDAPIVLSGGPVRNAVVESASMANWLKAQGISGDRIVEDPVALDTVGNAMGTISLSQIHGWYRIVLIAPGGQLDRAAVSLLARATAVGFDMSVDTVVVGVDVSSERRQGDRAKVFTHAMRAGGLFERCDVTSTGG